MIKFTVSIGVALFPDHADTKKSIIEQADQAMYKAKKLQRNLVYVVSPVALPDEKNGKVSRTSQGILSWPLHFERTDHEVR